MSNKHTDHQRSRASCGGYRYVQTLVDKKTFTLPMWQPVIVFCSCIRHSAIPQCPTWGRSSHCRHRFVQFHRLVRWWNNPDNAVCWLFYRRQGLLSGNYTVLLSVHQKHKELKILICKWCIMALWVIWKREVYYSTLQRKAPDLQAIGHIQYPVSNSLEQFG